ncbi:pyridoxamine 5'-phosphate oxidase family protein [Pseudonocardia kujensis]|uniref:pyridoxamine 5'-phosphate oxidase family protein n=1 Tax=Pseudonocardia kujensis TaxID=1128675 RepID=UPI001E4E3052|nr:pyridoxamine 5'-phosphate oxidase family protein [Pseudonocardia kujensis]MCE0763817.1 pyridoxamine 5'-phosphate oxidase family protein [Pseudonocardia kujensis]
MPDPSTAVSDGRADLVEIDRAECLRLLATADLGRVIYTEGAMPAAHPVSYVLDGEEIVFRSAGGATLIAATRGAVVAFQVDRIDAEDHTGWSVLGVGQAYEVTDRSRLSELVRQLRAPWPPSRPGHTIGMPLARLTGRRLIAR